MMRRKRRDGIIHVFFNLRWNTRAIVKSSLSRLTFAYKCQRSVLVLVVADIFVGDGLGAKTTQKYLVLIHMCINNACKYMWHFQYSQNQQYIAQQDKCMCDIVRWLFGYGLCSRTEMCFFPGRSETSTTFYWPLWHCLPLGLSVGHCR